MKVMLGISFAGGNWNNALASLARFRKAHEPMADFSVVVGVETLDNRDGQLRGRIKPTAAVFQAMVDQGWEEFFFWDGHLNTICKPSLANLPKPFYDDFSYGSAVNRLLMLGRYAGCDFLVRIDPGTQMPEKTRLRALIEMALDTLEHDPGITVVSGQYEGRLAIRDNNIFYDKKEAYTGSSSRRRGSTRRCK